MTKCNESLESGKKKDEEIKEVVIRVFMHCEGCKNQVSKCLIGFQGVEEVMADSLNQKVVIKGRHLDPTKILERVKNKYSKKAVLISPIILKVIEKEKPPPKKPEAVVKIVELKILMHCDGCVNDIKKCIERMSGVLSVEANKESSRVVVRGVMDSQSLAEQVRKRVGKKVEIVKEEREKEREKEKPKGKEKKNEEERSVIFYYPPQCSFHHFYSDQTFSDDNAFSCSVM